MTEKEQVKKGFNHGYAMQESNLDLAIQMANAYQLPLSPYSQGFISGVIEMVKERGEIAKYVKLLQTLDTSKSKEKTERGREPDFGMFEG